MIRRSGLVLLALFTSGCYFNLDLDVGSLTRVRPLHEVTVFGDDDDSPKLAMIEITGLISDAAVRSTFGAERPSSVARLREALKLAADDEDVLGLILRIRSPGGTVAASETLHHLIQNYKEETGQPVVAFFQGIAASGGYYAAMAADEIVAHPTAITGSIGVIMAGFNVSKLMDRFGIGDQTITSGAFKDSGTPLRAMRDEERAYLQQVVDELFARFVEVVNEGRPELDAAAIASLADGRIFTASQAHELGLVDSIGHLEDAVSALEMRAEVKDAQVIRYQRDGEYRENLYSRSSGSPTTVVDVKLLSFDRDRLEPGFYYLWPLGQ
jgi:protease-4